MVFLPLVALYRELVGCLVYLTVTRPDIAYAVHVVSQFFGMHHPMFIVATHWAALPQLIYWSCVTSGTSELNLLFSSDFELRAYADADWAVG